MKPLLLPFLKKLVVISVILAVLILLLFSFLLPSRHIPDLLFLLFFIFAFTFLSFSWLVKTPQDQFGKFIRKIMLITVLRLFVYILITVLYAVFFKSNLAIFAITFGVFYLIFTSFEVYELILGTGRPTLDKNKL